MTNRSWVVAVVASATVVVVLLVGLALVRSGSLPFAGGERCVVEDDGDRVELSLGEGDEAARVAGAAVAAGDRVPATATALADALDLDDDDATLLARAFTGAAPETFACAVPGDADEADDALGETGLVARSAAVREDVESVFGTQSLGGFAPGGVTDGHQEGSTHYEGRAVDIFFRPVNDTNRRRGWAIATYLVARADALDVQTVIFDDRIWRAGRDDSWRDYDAPDRAGDVAILEHRDHVHVDVFD